jgi:hypothetical protein
MSVKKEFVVSGTKVVVTHDILLMPDGMAFGNSIVPPHGDILTILKKPKKSQNVNFVRVSWQEQEYLAYYCQIRYNTNLI